MPLIPSSQALGQFTNAVKVVPTLMTTPQKFAKYFFPDVPTPTKYVTLYKRNLLNLLAKDVSAQEDAPLMSASKSSLLTFEPPHLKGKWAFSDITAWDKMLSSNNIETSVYDEAISELNRTAMIQSNTFENNILKQVADILNTGISTFDKATNINWQRPAELLVANNAGNTFATAGVDPFLVLGNLIEKLRQYGKMADTTFDLIFGETAWQDMQANDIFQKRVFENLNNNINMLRMPERSEIGTTFHGQLSLGNYKGNIYTYADTYETVASDGTVTRGNVYFDKKKVHILPQTNVGNYTARCAVNQIPYDFATRQVSAGEIVTANMVGEVYPDANQDSVYVRYKSSPLVVLANNYSIATVQVCA